MASKVTEKQYRSMIIDLRPEEIIAKEFGISKDYVRSIKKGLVLRNFRENLDEYHRTILDWQFRLELFVKARQKQHKTKVTEIYAEQFAKENPFPQKNGFILQNIKKGVAEK